MPHMPLPHDNLVCILSPTTKTHNNLMVGLHTNGANKETHSLTTVNCTLRFRVDPAVFRKFFLGGGCGSWQAL